MSFKGIPLKPGRKRSHDQTQTQTPSTPISTGTASPFSPSKQRKPIPSELTVYCYHAVAVLIMAVNAYP